MIIPNLFRLILCCPQSLGSSPYLQFPSCVLSPTLGLLHKLLSWICLPLSGSPSRSQIFSSALCTFAPLLTGAPVAPSDERTSRGVAIAGLILSPTWDCELSEGKGHAAFFIYLQLTEGSSSQWTLNNYLFNVTNWVTHRIRKYLNSEWDWSWVSTEMKMYCKLLKNLSPKKRSISLYHFLAPLKH